jgi:broad specificity phosphatase PhoE
MRGPTLLVLVRHAQSARNKAKKGRIFFSDATARKGVGGIPDHLVQLTESGHLQAKQTGQALRQQFGVFDHVETSGYARTEQTADDLLSAYASAEPSRMTRRTNLFLRERDTGYAYDMTEAEAATAFPWLDDYWHTFGHFLARPPGGESLADVVMRVQMYLDLIAQTSAARKLLIVTHARTIQCFRFNLEHWSYNEAETRLNEATPFNCSATVYSRQPGGKFKLVAYNEVYWSVGSPHDGE